MLTPCSLIPVYYNLGDEEKHSYLSGPGSRNATKDTVLVRRPTVADPSPRKIRVDLMGSTKMFGLSDGDDDPPEAYGFPFHEACWGVMAKLWVVDDQNLQDLLGVLRSFEVQPAHYTLLNWGHDYSGFAHYSTSKDETVPGDMGSHRIETHLQSQIHSYHKHNPRDCSELRRIFKKAASDAVAAIAAPPMFSNRSHANKAEDHAMERDGLGSCFSALPPELLEMILECLPLSDALALRVASREFVNLGLHDVFWRSRFLPARELGFAFEAQPYFSSLHGQWKSLGRAVKRIQPPPSIHGPIKYLQPPPSLVNRVRIWGLAAALGELVKIAEDSNCQGTGVAPSLWLEFPVLRRPQFERMLLIPDQPAAVVVSTIRVHGRQYVSGIRVQHKGDGDHSVSFGYLHSTDETLLVDCKVHHARWIGLHLALDLDGIRGLAAVTESGTVSAWVGDHEGLIKQSLAFKSGKQEASMLWGGFDVSPDCFPTFLTVTSNHASGQGPQASMPGSVATGYNQT
jgi:hypothetical protein